MAKAGGLMAYAPDILDQFRQAAGYVKKILDGAKPGDLPLQYPSRWTLVVNLKTAKAIGVVLSPATLSRADQVIEQPVLDQRGRLLRTAADNQVC